MNNLKRVLSVGMASTMVLGMMATASAASFNDFTDKGDIVNKDAVSMVTELGIIAGLPDGSYGATQNIDRASFARLVCVALNGGKEPNLGNLKTTFTDTQGHWAEKYIAYCVQQGIIAGKGNNTFAPSANVTGSEAAKMLLVALGYNTTYEKIGGATWQVSTDVLANQAGLYEDLSGMNTSAALTRDQAAQMIYNTLNADLVKYEMVPGISSNGQVTMTTQRVNVTKTVNGNTKNVTMLEDAFNAVKVEGVVLGNEYASVNGAGVQDEGKTYISLTDTVAGLNSGSFEVSTGLDMIGKSVTLYVKPDANSNQASKATVLGNALASDTNKVAVLTSKKDTTAKINDYLDDNNLKTSTSTEWYVNYGTKLGSALTSNERGKVLTFIDNNDDGVVDYALQMVKTFGQVTSYNDSKGGTINVSAVNPADGISYKNLSSTKAAKDINGFEDVKKDDYVFFYKIGNKEFVEPAKSVEVTVDSIKGDKVTADGTEYEQSGLVKFVNEDGDKALKDAVDLGDKATFYLDESGYVVYTDAEGTADEYLMVLDVDTYSSVDGYARTKILKTDGTTEVVNAYYDNAGTKEAAKDDALYAYTVNSKGVYKLVLTDLTEKSVNGKTVTKGNPVIDAGNVTANAQTVFVIDRGNDTYTVYTGIANVPKTIDITKGSAIVDKGGIAKAIFISESSMTGATEGIYVLDKDPTVSGSSDDKTYTYDVIYKGEKTTLTGDNNLFSAEGYYNNVSVNGTEITKVTGSATQPSEALKASKGLVQNGQGSFSYNDDTKVLYVDGTDVSDSSIGAITVKDGSIAGDNIIVIADSDYANIAAYVLICK